MIIFKSATSRYWHHSSSALNILFPVEAREPENMSNLNLILLQDEKDQLIQKRMPAMPVIERSIVLRTRLLRFKPRMLCFNALWHILGLDFWNSVSDNVCTP